MKNIVERLKGATDFLPSGHLLQQKINNALMKLKRNDEARVDVINGHVTYTGQREDVVDYQGFPDELIIEIFSYLGWKEIMECSHLSREWRRIARDEILWGRLIKSNKLPRNYITRLNLLEYIFEMSLLNGSQLKEVSEQGAGSFPLLNTFQLGIIEKAAVTANFELDDGEEDTLEARGGAEKPRGLFDVPLCSASLCWPRDLSSETKKEKIVHFYMAKKCIQLLCEADEDDQEKLTQSMSFLKKLKVGAEDIRREEITSIISAIFNYLTTKDHPFSEYLFFKLVELSVAYNMNIDALSEEQKGRFINQCKAYFTSSEDHLYSHGRLNDLITFGLKWRHLDEELKHRIFRLEWVILSKYPPNCALAMRQDYDDCNSDDLKTSFRFIAKLKVDREGLIDEDFEAVLARCIHLMTFPVSWQDLICLVIKHLSIPFRDMNANLIIIAIFNYLTTEDHPVPEYFFFKLVTLSVAYNMDIDDLSEEQKGWFINQCKAYFTSSEDHLYSHDRLEDLITFGLRWRHLDEELKHSIFRLGWVIFIIQPGDIPLAFARERQFDNSYYSYYNYCDYNSYCLKTSFRFIEKLKVDLEGLTGEDFEAVLARCNHLCKFPMEFLKRSDLIYLVINHLSIPFRDMNATIQREAPIISLVRGLRYFDIKFNELPSSSQLGLVRIYHGYERGLGIDGFLSLSQELYECGVKWSDVFDNPFILSFFRDFFYAHLRHAICLQDARSVDMLLKFNLGWEGIHHPILFDDKKEVVREIRLCLQSMDRYKKFEAYKLLLKLGFTKRKLPELKIAVRAEKNKRNVTVYCGPPPVFSEGAVNKGGDENNGFESPPAYSPKTASKSRPS